MYRIVSFLQNEPMESEKTRFLQTAQPSICWARIENCILYQQPPLANRPGKREHHDMRHGVCHSRRTKAGLIQLSGSLVVSRAGESTISVPQNFFIFNVIRGSQLEDKKILEAALRHKDNDKCIPLHLFLNKSALLQTQFKDLLQFHLQQSKTRHCGMLSHPLMHG